MNSRIKQLICRTCLKVVLENELYITAESRTKYGNVIDMLETCVSEINTDQTNDVILCCKCMTMLRISYEFKLRCLITEDKVFKYLKHNKLPIFSKINLADVNTVLSPRSLNKNVVTSNAEADKQNEIVASSRKEVAENSISDQHILNMRDTKYFKKKIISEEDNVAVCKLNRIRETNKLDCIDGVLTFDDLSTMNMDASHRNGIN